VLDLTGYLIPGIALLGFIVTLATVGRHSPKPPVIIKPVTSRVINPAIPMVVQNQISNVRWPINY
jgi:hypothetical protein